jgi:hypothetical protein
MITRWQRHQRVTSEPASQPFMEYLDQLANGTDNKTDFGHTHPIADVEGLGTALAGKADAAHTHLAAQITDLPEAIEDRVASLLQAGANITLTYDDGLGTLTIDASGGGSSEARGQATVTVPNARYEWTETVAAVGVTPAMGVMLAIGAHVNQDENTAEMLDIMAMSATPGTDQITVEMAFTTKTSGPIRLNWSAA